MPTKRKPVELTASAKKKLPIVKANRAIAARKGGLGNVKATKAKKDSRMSKIMKQIKKTQGN